MATQNVVNEKHLEKVCSLPYWLHCNEHNGHSYVVNCYNYTTMITVSGTLQIKSTLHLVL